MNRLILPMVLLIISSAAIAQTPGKFSKILPKSKQEKDYFSFKLRSLIRNNQLNLNGDKPIPQDSIIYDSLFIYNSVTKDFGRLLFNRDIDGVLTHQISFNINKDKKTINANFMPIDLSGKNKNKLYKNALTIKGILENYDNPIYDDTFSRYNGELTLSFNHRFNSKLIRLAGEENLYDTIYRRATRNDTIFFAPVIKISQKASGEELYKRLTSFSLSGITKSFDELILFKNDISTLSYRTQKGHTFGWSASLTSYHWWNNNYNWAAYGKRVLGLFHKRRPQFAYYNATLRYFLKDNNIEDLGKRQLNEEISYYDSAKNLTRTLAKTTNILVGDYKEFAAVKLTLNTAIGFGDYFYVDLLYSIENTSDDYSKYTHVIQPQLVVSLKNDKGDRKTNIGIYARWKDFEHPVVGINTTIPFVF